MEELVVKGFIGIIFFIITLGVIILVAGIVIEGSDWIMTKYNKRKLMKKNNPKGFKAGDLVHVRGSHWFDETRAYKIDRIHPKYVVINGLGVYYRKLSPHKKIYCGGE